MPKVTTQSLHTDEIAFRYNINVTSEGVFTTTIPAEAAEQIEAVGIRLDINRLGNRGYFEAKSIDKLKEQVSNVIAEYRSSKMIWEGIVIRYSISLSCRYGKIANGGMGILTPNCSGEFTEQDEEAEWQNGNFESSHFNRKPFGFTVFAKPYYKEIKERKNGKRHTSFRRLTDEEQAQGHWLNYLDSFVQDSPHDLKSRHYKDIKYTEEGAKFFADMLMSICKLNEKAKHFLEPDAIQAIIDSKQKLI